MVPVTDGCDPKDMLAAAAAIGAETVLIGIVRVPAGEPLSAASGAARRVRSVLRRLGADPRIRSKARVRVSTEPLAELSEVVAGESPDLLLIDWDCALVGLGVTPDEVLIHPPANLALLRGAMGAAAPRILLPVRGGPYAELALRLALSLKPTEIVPLHLTRSDGPASDAPFRGLERVLRQLPDVRPRYATTDDPSATILDEAKDFDLVVMGASARPEMSEPALGPVADRVIREAEASVIVVKTRRPMPAGPHDETVGSQAISILVDKWFAENTLQADEFADLEDLVARKREQGLTISLALPALNEEATVGKVIRTLKRGLQAQAPLVDEIVMMDSASHDRTREIAGRLGIPVFIHQEVLPRLGSRQGKGEALWKSLLVTSGDIVVWIDTDIVNIHPRFVYGLIGPLLLDPRIQLVKGFYRRPLRVGERLQAGGGGRVTELTARPLLNLFYPELSGIIQPLSGEYAGRRSALEVLPFFSGYGVETGLLIDVFERYGLSAVAQVDLLERVHHNQPLEALSKMSFAIIQAVIRKMEGRIGRPMLDEVNKSMKLIRYQAGDYRLEVEEIAERERPPMIEVPEYQEKRRAKAAVNRRSGEGQGAEGARSPSAPGSRRRRGG
jgi:glucosyl-3-phosphoglycerate synthase